MNRVLYYLVCHETASKVCIGSGVHTLQWTCFDTQALTDFVCDNILFPLVVEWAKEDIQDYKDYTTIED